MTRGLVVHEIVSVLVLWESLYEHAVAFFQFAFPFVHAVRVREYRFRPPDVVEHEDVHEGEGGARLRSQPPHPISTWNCDGEHLPNAAIDFR